ncbi:MAG: hypothetical protein ABI559_03655 [Chloroflexota bacterium]
MMKVTLVLLLPLIAALGLACSGDDDKPPTTATPVPTPTSLIPGVPASAIDGSTGSEDFQPAPSGVNPAIGEEAARSQAQSNLAGDGEIVQMILLNSIDHLHQPANPPTLVWVADLAPESVTSLANGGGVCEAPCATQGEVRTDYAYVVIDATTGAFLHEAVSSYEVTATPSR